MKIEDLKTGDTILTQSKGILPRLIRFITKSEYNHAKSVVRLGNEIWIYESNFLYTKELAITNLKSKNKYLVKRPVFTVDKVKYINSCDDLLYRLYDFKGTFVQELIFNITKNITGKGIYPFKDNEKLFYCSEAAIYHYNNSSYIKLIDNISPADIERNKILFLDFELEL